MSHRVGTHRLRKHCNDFHAFPVELETRFFCRQRPHLSMSRRRHRRTKTKSTDRTRKPSGSIQRPRIGRNPRVPPRTNTSPRVTRPPRDAGRGIRRPKIEMDRRFGESLPMADRPAPSRGMVTSASFCVEFFIEAVCVATCLFGAVSLPFAYVTIDVSCALPCASQPCGEGEVFRPLYGVRRIRASDTRSEKVRSKVLRGDNRRNDEFFFIDGWQGRHRFAIRLPTRTPRHSPIAQLVEHSTVNRIVAGSSPARGAILLFRPIDGSLIARSANSNCLPPSANHRLAFSSHGLVMPLCCDSLGPRCKERAMDDDPIRRSHHSR